MERAELERFKNMLLDRLHALEQPLRRREEIAVENTPDTIDSVQNAAERELAISQIESNSNQFQSLKFASSCRDIRADAAQTVGPPKLPRDTPKYPK